MDRKQFTFYDSFALAIQRIKNKATRCAAYDAIVTYALSGALPDLEKMPTEASIVFDLCKPHLDTARRKAAGGMNKDRAKITERCEEDDGKITERCEEDDANKKKNKDKKKNKIKNICYTPTVPLEAENEDAEKMGDGWEEFWAAYPVKTGSIEGACHYYLAALNKTTPEALLAAVKEQRAYWEAQGSRYTPSAEKWLKNGMWAQKMTMPQEKKKPTGMESAAEYRSTPKRFGSNLDELEKVYGGAG